MTNLDILKQAAQSAVEQALRGERLDPDDAWHRWSAATGITGPGARYLFETEYTSQWEALNRRH